jgi:hypothetical protein
VTRPSDNVAVTLRSYRYIDANIQSALTSPYHYAPNFHYPKAGGIVWGKWLSDASHLAGSVTVNEFPRFGITERPKTILILISGE